MTELTAPPVELAVDDRLKARLGALLKGTTLDFRAMARAAGLAPATSFRGKRIRGVDFGESDLTGFDFTGAELTDCDFSRARTEGANFAGARLNGVCGLKRRGPMVFVSSAAADGYVARVIIKGLMQRGVPFLSHEDPFVLGSDLSMAMAISSALGQYSHLLLIASPRSLESPAVEAEWQAALRHAVVLVPALLGVTVQELPIPLRRFHALDLSDMETALDRLADEVLQWPPTTRVIPQQSPHFIR